MTRHNDQLVQDPTCLSYLSVFTDASILAADD